MIDRIRVVARPGDRAHGTIIAGPFRAPCALGRAGIVTRKREGDGGTPAGNFRMVSVLYRADKGPRPITRLPARAIAPADGWCDDPADRRYNRPVALPYPARHERMWRKDRLYDVVVVLDYNLGPVIAGRGSAIFLHIARKDFAPTEGCVAIAPDAMRRLLARADARTSILIGGGRPRPSRARRASS